MDEIFWDETVQSADAEDQHLEARNSRPVDLDVQVQNKDDLEKPLPASLPVLCTYVPGTNEPPSESQETEVSNADLPAPRRRMTPGGEPLDPVPAVGPKAAIKPTGVRFLVPTNSR
jgi:hypothetical protein